MTQVTMTADGTTSNAAQDKTALVDVLNSENTSLEEKLAAIDAAMKNAQAQANDKAAKNGTVAAPFDPADLTVCDSCQ